MSQLLRKIRYFDHPQLTNDREMLLTEQTAYYIMGQFKQGLSVASRVAFIDESTSYNMVFVPLPDARHSPRAIMAWGGGNGDVYIGRERFGGFAFALHKGIDTHPGYVAEKLNMNPNDPITDKIAKFINLLRDIKFKE